MSKRLVYIHSKTRNYLESDYKELFKKKNAFLEKGNTQVLQTFIQNNDNIQLDTETNVTEYTLDRKLYVIQIGDYHGLEQHIFDFTDLDDDTIEILRRLFDSDKTFIAHNAKFEYIVLYMHFKVYIKNFKDTFIASKLITAGLDLPKGYNSLANLVLLRFGVDLSKAAQTTFTGEKMTPEQLLYADSDVLYLGKLLDVLMAPLRKWKLLKVFKLENRSIRPIGDMTINGILIDTKKLDANIIDYDEQAAQYREEMVQAFKNEENQEIKDAIKEMNIIQNMDEVVINWNSSVQKRAILNKFYPDEGIKSISKTLLLKLSKTVENPMILEKLLNGETKSIEVLLASRHRQFLIDNNMLIPKGNLNLNFNSPSQLLDFFKLWYPTIKGVGVNDLKKLKHPVIMAYKKYTKAQKLVSSFGRKMYTYIEEDGRIHAGFTQLVPTGSRMSSSKPRNIGFVKFRELLETLNNLKDVVMGNQQLSFVEIR